MAKLLRQNVGGVDYTIAGCALTGVCSTAAADYVKQVTLSDGDVIGDGMMVVVTFANGNTAGNAPNAKTIYSSDQINYFEDDQLTVPFTLAPEGCYEIEYTGTANAYTYIDYPVFQVGSVTGPVCDYRGHITSGDLWSAGDSVQCMLKEGKFLLLGGSGGSGNPVGTVIAVYSNKVPNGYLPCNGVAFDTAQFPVLYALLGDDHTPDLRECVLVGAGTSDRTMGAHDVYTVGQFKDDQLQNITGKINISAKNGSNTGVFADTNSFTYADGLSASGTQWSGLDFNASKVARAGTTTHGKQVGVNWCIKATSGINESQADYILSALSPVNEVTANNLHSVTSGAVANFIINLTGVFTVSLTNNGFQNVTVTFDTPLPNANYVLTFQTLNIGGVVFTSTVQGTNSFAVNVRNLNGFDLGSVVCYWYLICRR